MVFSVIFANYMLVGKDGWNLFAGFPSCPSLTYERQKYMQKCTELNKNSTQVVPLLYLTGTDPLFPGP